MTIAYTLHVPRILSRPGSTPYRFPDIGGVIREVLDGETIVVETTHGMVVEVKFVDPTLSEPAYWDLWGNRCRLTPQMAKIMRHTYAAEVGVTAHMVVRADRERGLASAWQTRNYTIGSVPIPVGCEVCPTRDPAYRVERPEYIEPPGIEGQFITHGSPRHVIPIECMRNNTVICFAGTKRCELRTRVSQFSPIVYLVVKCDAGGCMTFSQSSAFRGEVPLTTAFAALGFVTDRQVAELMFAGIPDGVLETLAPMLTPSFDAREHLSEESALAALRERTSSDAKCVIQRIVPNAQSNFERALTIARIAARLVLVTGGVSDPDDRDSMATKGVLSPAVGWAELFRSAIHRSSSHMAKTIKTDIAPGGKPPPASTIAQSLERGSKCGFLENTMRRPIATGGSTSPYSGEEMQVSDAVNPMNMFSLMAARKIHLPRSVTGTGGRCTGQREITGGMYGFVCVEDTSDGATVGTTKSLTSMADFAEWSDPNHVRAAIAEIDGVVQTTDTTPRDVLVMLNGAALGFSRSPIKLVRGLLARKCRAEIHPHTAVVWSPEERTVVISTDADRIVRPLYVVDPDGRLPDTSWVTGDTTLTDLISRGVVEFVDPREASMRSYVALHPREVAPGSDHTHCEIHPGAIHNMQMSIHPYPNMSQSPRNAYQCGMGKQAISFIPHMNYLGAVGSSTYMQPFAQRTLVTSLSAVWCGADVRDRTGYNARVLVISDPRGSEDPTQHNAGSLDFGMGFCVGIYCDTHDTCTNTGCDESYGGGDPEAGVTGPDGLPVPGRRVRPGEVIIRKSAQRSTPEGIVTCQRDVYLAQRTAGATDDKVIRIMRADRYVNQQGQNCCSVYTSCPIETSEGDKAASRHAQKGVIARRIPLEEMPYDEHGSYDIIINPHALPSRMTIGMLLEMLISRAAIETCEVHYVEPFAQNAVDDAMNRLQDLDLPRLGVGTVYCGRTGAPFHTEIFGGTCMYQKLRHLVEGKMHGRGGRGPRNVLTRQPPEGKKNHGGLRFGEMEKDAIVAHGCSWALLGKTMRDSDQFDTFVCTTCGTVANQKIPRDRYRDLGDGEGPETWCHACRGTSLCVRAAIPWCFNVLRHELQGLGVNTRLPSV